MRRRPARVADDFCENRCNALVLPLRVKSAPSRWLLAAVAFNQLTAWATFYYAFSIFAIPMQSSLGWPQQNLMGAFTLGLLGWATGSIPIGMAIDRGYGRVVMASGSLLGGVLLIAWSQAGSLPGFYAIWFAFGFALAANLYDPLFSIITRTYGEGFHRAITTVTLVGGFASTLAYPLILWLIDWQGWRGALVILGAWQIIVNAPLHWWAIGRLEGHAMPARVTKRGAASGGLGPVLRLPVFWFLAFTFAGQLFVVSAMWAHMMPMLLSLNLSTAEAVRVVMWIGPTQVAGRVLQFLLMRHVTVTILGQVAFLLLPFGLIALHLIPSPLVGAYAFAFCIGASNGVATIVRGTAIPEFIGKADIGAVSGAMTAATSFTRAIAPFLAALMFSFSGYSGMLRVLAAIGLASVAAFWMAANISVRGRR